MTITNLAFAFLSHEYVSFNLKVNKKLAIMKKVKYIVKMNRDVFGSNEEHCLNLNEIII